MSDSNKYYLIKQRAVPEVLLKVLEAKRLLESGASATIQEATEKVELSRSSFYKYKDDIFPFHENVKGQTVTFVLQMDDRPGKLSNLLKFIAGYDANILTIHQTIPINGVASLTLSVQMPAAGDISEMINELHATDGVHYAKILSRE